MKTTELDRHGQPKVRAFNHHRNMKKYAYTLRGILEGVVADKKLNEEELLFLDMWLQSSNTVKTGDTVDLLDLITGAVEDEIISEKELQEIYDLINDIIHYGTEASSEIEDTINELIGILRGISADKQITEDEFYHLDKWINNNKHISEEWIVEKIVEQITKIKNDGKVTKEELDHLLPIIESLSGQSFLETGLADGGVSEVFSTNIECFVHKGKTICFTGEFLEGTRKSIENVAKNLGAKTVNSVTKNVDALIIGTFSSRDWRFTSYGRKIEKALKQQKAGHHIKILSERQWMKAIKNNCDE
jgi:NAD-dependent DNA ligase